MKKGLNGNLYASDFFYELEKYGFESDLFARSEIVAAIKRAINTNINNQIEDKVGGKMKIEFRYKLVENKTTNPETLNRLRTLMMAFEQTANQVMPEFRLHLEEINKDGD